MGLLAWIRGLVGGASAPSASRARPAAALDGPAPALPRRAPPPGHTPELDYLPRPTDVGNLDAAASMTVVAEGPEEQLLWKLSRRLDRGDYEVPQLPATTLSALDLAGRPSADVHALVELITTDPLLSGELLRLANSALYAGRVPAETLHQAVMRVGLRELRGLIFTVSLRGVLLKDRVLRKYAEEVWRQALSVARVARAISRPLGVDPEQAYLLGLLHDVGKVALLTLLREEGRQGNDLTTALVGQTFHALHEKAGATMARAWRLPLGVASVAGTHHDPGANREHPREAALALLAHQIDLFDTLGDEQGFHALASHPAFELLGVSETARQDALFAARRELDRAREAALAAA
jgi:putative nucleotidyltransferase with HDIG domain